MKTQIIFYLLLLPCLLFAQPQQSEDFRITKSVLDASGGAAASEDFRLVSAVAQPSPLGTQSSETFALYPGFLTPEFGVAIFSPIQNLVIQWLEGTAHMRLAWPHVDGANSYIIHRGTVATFIPAVGNEIGMTVDTTFTDENVITLAPAKYFYSVAASAEIPPALTVKNGTLIAGPAAPESQKR